MNIVAVGSLLVTVAAVLFWGRPVLLPRDRREALLRLVRKGCTLGEFGPTKLSAGRNCRRALKWQADKIGGRDCRAGGNMIESTSGAYPHEAQYVDLSHFTGARVQERSKLDTMRGNLRRAQTTDDQPTLRVNMNAMLKDCCHKRRDAIADRAIANSLPTQRRAARACYHRPLRRAIHGTLRRRKNGARNVQVQLGHNHQEPPWKRCLP